MRLHDMRALRAAVPPGGRLIGLDPGARRIGVALSDVTLLLATPRDAIPRGKLARDAAGIAGFAARHGAYGLVVGLPLGLDGSFGPAAQAAKDWAMALSAASRLPAALWDERLSTAAVERAMLDADLSRRRRAARIDSAAAAYVLQAALDATRPAPHS